MVNEEPKCVQWKRLGAEQIREELKGFTREEELEYWRKKTEESRARQQETRAKLANKRQGIGERLPSQNFLSTQGVKLHSISSEEKVIKPKLPDDVEAELEAMSNLLDETLWILARNTMTIQDKEQFAALNQEVKLRSLNHQEKAEQDRLLGLYDRTMLRKAQAAYLLSRRGYDMSDPAVLQN